MSTLDLRDLPELPAVRQPLRRGTPPADLPTVVLGLDPGTRTGLAVATPDPGGTWRWVELRTLPVHQALLLVRELLSEAGSLRRDVLVIVEDARQVRFGTDRVKIQGAGSVKRDCALWEDALADWLPELLPHGGRGYVLLARPGGKRSLRKCPAGQLALVTGCDLPGSSHARDAAALAWEQFLHDPAGCWRTLPALPATGPGHRLLQF